MTSTNDGLPIPQPPPFLFFGNVKDVDPSNVPASFWHLAEVYGEIYQLDMPAGKLIVCSSYELVNDLCDASRFEKPVRGALKEVRALTGDGLFTAYPNEPNWGIAHRVLMPVFGPMGIRKMWGGMMDIATQLLLRWDRFGPDNEILCSDEFTRTTFDMIGLCAFGYRFNNFYLDEPHFFVTKMTEVLRESGRRSGRTSIENNLRIFAARENEENVRAMHKVCNDIIEDRIRHPQPDSTDLLNPMLYGKDPETGETMSKESVRNNMATFLVAGHETTSGTLGFVFYHLLKNPETYLRLQQEVDEVLGQDPMELKHVSQLPYVKYTVYEALRFMGPIALISKHALEPTKIAGKYHVDPDWQIVMNLRPFMHDRKVWGEDADLFRPERFLNGGYEKLPPNAFKAFGDGPRACIGRGFAEQEMIMLVALIVQNFQVEMADPTYELQTFVALTLKPDNFKIKVKRRPGRDLSVALGGRSFKQPGKAEPIRSAPNVSARQQELRPMIILYGSNSGTCKSYAEELKSDAARYGFEAEVGTLDSATEHIPKDRPVVIIAPSYEGKPADNAKKFVQWLESGLADDHLKDVKYAIFGVGNSDWAQTFHRVPKEIDEIFVRHGAQGFTKTGYVDVKYDIMGPWEDWTEQMWHDLRKTSGTTSAISGNQLKVAISAPTFVSHLGGADLGYGTVKVNRDLGGASVGLPKKHMEIELPPGVGYRAGDYMAILPLNPDETAERVLKRFQLSPDDSITISGTNKAFLSPDVAVSIFDLLMTRVELGTPASQKQIENLANATPERGRQQLMDLTKDDAYKREVLAKRLSLIDLLEMHGECALPFEQYLDMLKPLTPRQYSISSSPLANIGYVQGSDKQIVQTIKASLTYDVHEEPALSGHGLFHGVASTYLARQKPGARVRCTTRSTNVNFHLPPESNTPIIMVCAGSGLAPMRGFIQERALIKAARGNEVGPAILYFGCRDFEADFIYADELRQWESAGVVSVRPCFSRRGPPGQKGNMHVHERIWEEREEISELFAQGAKIFVCGSASKLGKSAAEVSKKIWLWKHEGENEEAAQAWLHKVKEDRYVSDTFE